MLVNLQLSDFDILLVTYMIFLNTDRCKTYSIYPIFIINSSLHFEFGNRKYLQLYGYKKQMKCICYNNPKIIVVKLERQKK